MLVSATIKIILSLTLLYRRVVRGLYYFFFFFYNASYTVSTGTLITIVVGRVGPALNLSRI